MVTGVVEANPNQDEMGTPNINTIIDWVRSEYPDLPRIQTTNCRKIAGSSTWSQHSWANAADIFVDPETGNELKPRLIEKFGPHIKVILWQVPNHYDHIHVDTWPTGVGTPPCAGGSLQVRHRDGSMGSVFTDDIEEGGDEMSTAALRNQVVEAGAKGWLPTTEAVNYWLAKANNPADPEWRSDFEPMWAREKQKEYLTIKDGLVKPAATAAPTMSAIAADMAKRLTNG